MASESMETKEEFHLFGAKESPLHPHHNAEFQVDGVKYNFIEQYVLHKKAEMCKSTKDAAELMKISDPNHLSKFDKKFIVPDDKVWEAKLREFTKKGYLEKSRQVKALFDLLKETRGKILVYASQNDSILGIGVDANDPLSRRRSNWKGTNLLGDWLMEIREELPDRLESSFDDISSKQESTDGSTQHKETVGEEESHGSEKFTFFWKTQSPFNQGYPCSFVIDDQWYNCAEQYMMHQKAVTFGDQQTGQRVLKSTDPQEQKHLGGKVSDFDDEKWNLVAMDVVKKGNLAKFGQSKELKGLIFETAGTTLVEASPDNFWGIGLRATDPRANDRSQWLGKNQLGEVLTEVREELMRLETGKLPSKDGERSIETGEKENNSVEMRSKAENSCDETSIAESAADGLAQSSSPSRSHGEAPKPVEKMECSDAGEGNEEVVEMGDPGWRGFSTMEVDIEEDEKEKKKRERSKDDHQERSDKERALKKGKTVYDSRNEQDEPAARSKFDDKASPEKFTFFWQADSPFSQHHPANFIIDGVQYNCAEQFMMHQKAVVFKDEKIGSEIMNAENPAKQKSLAKQVEGFDEVHWKTLRRDVVKRGNIEKFSQNPRLRRMLFATAGTTMVEASPTDSTWGIALNADDPKAWQRRTWSGGNLLGEILTEVREELMEKFKIIHEDEEDVMDYKDFSQGNKDGRDEQYTIFWRPVSPFHPRYPVGFELDNQFYQTLQQYLLHEKALFFNDGATARAIMENSRLNKLDELGRNIRNYDHNSWSKYCRSYLRLGNFAKFSQNRNVGQQLFDNVQHGELVYAAEEDSLLGVGLKEGDGRLFQRKYWKGKNLLGRALMEVRDMLLRNDQTLPEITEDPDDEVVDELPNSSQDEDMRRSEGDISSEFREAAEDDKGIDPEPDNLGEQINLQAGPPMPPVLGNVLPANPQAALNVPGNVLPANPQAALNVPGNVLPANPQAANVPGNASINLLGNAYEALHDLIPESLKNLKDKVGCLQVVNCARRRVCQTCQVGAGAPSVGRKRALTKRIEELRFCINFLLEQLHRSKQKKPAKYQKQLLAKRSDFDDFLSKEKTLFEEHVQQHLRTNDSQSSEQKVNLDHAHALLGHQMFDFYRLQIQQESTEEDNGTVLSNVTELSAVVSITDAACQHLVNWLQGTQVLEGTQLLAMAQKCLVSLQAAPNFQQYSNARAVLVANATAVPCSMVDLLALDVIDANSGSVWRTFGSGLLSSLKQLELFAIKNLQYLDSNRVRSQLIQQILAAMLQEMK